MQIKDRPEIIWEMPQPSEEDLILAKEWLRIFRQFIQLQYGRAADLSPCDHLTFKRIVPKVFNERNFVWADSRELHIISHVHAQVYLSQMKLMSEATLSDAGGLLPGWQATIDQPLYGRALYRGQTRYRKPALSSMYREHLDSSKRGSFENALKLYTAVLVATFSQVRDRFEDGSLPPLSLNALTATAQHYGVPTPLLDWTRNSDTALTFASGHKQPTGNELTLVYALPLDEALQLGLRMVLPPIYTYRLYLQQGVFIWLEEDLYKHQGVITISCV